MYTYCRPFGQDEEKHATWDNMFAKVSWKQAKGMWRVQRGQVFIVFSLLIKFLTIFTAFSQFNIGCISWLFMSMCIGIGLYFPLVARRWRWDMVEEQGDQRWATEDWWDPKTDCWYIYILYYQVILYYIYNILYIINKYILYIFYIYIHIHIYIYIYICRHCCNVCTSHAIRLGVAQWDARVGPEHSWGHHRFLPCSSFLRLRLPHVRRHAGEDHHRQGAHGEEAQGIQTSWYI